MFNQLKRLTISRSSRSDKPSLILEYFPEVSRTTMGDFLFTKSKEFGYKLQSKAIKITSSTQYNPFSRTVPQLFPQSKEGYLIANRIGCAL